MNNDELDARRQAEDELTAVREGCSKTAGLEQVMHQYGLDD